MFQERRITPRIRTYHPVRLFRPGDPKPIETLTKDLAAGGLRCVSPCALPVSTELNVELVLSTGEELLTARGRTAWFQMLPKSDQFELGIAFVEVPPRHHQHLSTYLGRVTRQAVTV